MKKYLLPILVSFLLIGCSGGKSSIPMNDYQSNDPKVLDLNINRVVKKDLLKNVPDEKKQ
ncbi:MAG: hypothetical protein OFPII_43130 [Osedax symbiont Rs1]|nr:MAG: hypothetical protein OFPII_43130 [Osedax symbiont Rs1]